MLRHGRSNETSVQPLCTRYQHTEGAASLQAGDIHGCISVDELHEVDAAYTTVAWHQGRERAEGVQGKQIAICNIQRHVRLSQARGTYPALRTPMFRLRPPRWQGELMEGETTVGE